MLTNVLLWSDGAGPYIDAIAAAGLKDRVNVEVLSRSERPNQAQKASTEVMLGWGAPKGLLPEMTSLKWVQALTAGVEMWLTLPDLPAGLTLTCARGTHRESMPENIVGGLFHLTKPYALANQDQQASKWTRRMATPLSGQTLGILGVGEIGARVAKIASAIGMRVIGTKRRPEPTECVEAVLPTERTDEVLAQSDFVLLLLPATPATENFMNAERLGKMKSSAYLLNFGRGALIDDAALIDAVTNKKIAGAVLDVFRQEPLPAEHPFWQTPGIQVLPHIGGGHPKRDGVVAKLFVDNLSRYLDGKPLTQVVDRVAGY